MKGLYLLVLAIFLPSCLSMSRREQEQYVLEQPVFTASTRKALQQPEFLRGNWPEKNWWEMFHSKELSSLIESALESNPSISAIKERIEFAREQAVIARSKLSPYVYFNADDEFTLVSKYGIIHTLNPCLKRLVNLIDLNLLFTYEFDFWSKYRNLTRSALAKAASDIAQSKQVELIVSASLATAYFGLKTNLQKKRLYEEFANVRKKFLNLQTLLNQKALLSMIPITHSEEGYLAAKKSIAQIEQEIETTKHLINILRGMGPDEPLAIDDSCLDFTYKIVIPENLNLNLIARRPDLAAAIFRASALAHEVGAAIAEFFPNISLSGLLGLESLRLNKLFNSASGTFAIEPALNLPIFTAGAIRANVRGKKALYNQAIFEYNELLLRSTQEIADTLSTLRAIFQKKEEQKQIVKQADLRLHIVYRNFSKGLDDLLQVYQSEEALISQQLIDVDLLYEEYMGTIKFIKALGGGYE